MIDKIIKDKNQIAYSKIFKIKKEFKYIIHKYFSYFILILFVLSLILLSSKQIYAQNEDLYKTFLIKGLVKYILPNFDTPFELIDGSIIPSNCRLITDKNGYLEFHSKKNLIRVLPSSTLEIKNNQIELVNGTIYINTLDKININCSGENLIIYNGIIILQISKEILINFVNDAMVEINSKVFQPTKNDRIFSLNKKELIKSNEKISLNKFDLFPNEINKKVENLNDLIDIFFERIFYLIEKNNNFIQKIDTAEKNSFELEKKLNEQLKSIENSKGELLQILNKYSEIYQSVESEILDYKFIRYHYLEFYFQMRNYFEYYKRLIEYANDVNHLNDFDEFPDYSSKSSFMIVYDKIKSFTETVRLSYQVLEITYINILDSNSTINKSFIKYENIKSKIIQKIEEIIKSSITQLPNDLIDLISQTFLTQIESKVSTTIYINRLYDILLLLNNEFIEDEKIINKFFSLDDIVYKFLYLKQAEDIKDELIQNFTNLDRNISILKYLNSNSKLIKDDEAKKLLYSIIQFYPDYEEDNLSMLSIADEISKAYKKYTNLLKYFLKKDDATYYQSLLNKEIDKYLNYLSFTQNEIIKVKESDKVDISYLNSLINIQDNLILITYKIYETLKFKYSLIQFPKKMYIDQQKEYISNLKKEIENLNYEEKLNKKNQEIKKILIIRIILINQVIEDIANFKQSIKDYSYQKANVEKSLQLYNLAIANKNNFSAQNYSENTSLIWETNQLLVSLDDFILLINNFESQLKIFFEDIQGFYLMESFDEENIDKINKKIENLKMIYNDFTLYYFNLIEKIYQFSTNISIIQSSNNDILIKDIIKDLNTFIFLYKSKIDSFRSILAIIKVIF